MLYKKAQVITRSDCDFVQRGKKRESDLNKLCAIAYPGNDDYINTSLHKKR